MKALSLDSSRAGEDADAAIWFPPLRGDSRISLGPGVRCLPCCSASQGDGKGGVRYLSISCAGDYFSGAVPGVALVSSGEGLMCPSAFSGVSERTDVGPGPAVPGLSPRGPEGSIPCRLVSGDLLSTGVPTGCGFVAMFRDPFAVE